MPDLRGDVRHGRTGAYDPRALGPWVALAAILLLVAAAALVAPRTVAAPAFTLASTGLEGGVQGEPVRFSLSDYRGRVVVLDLMAVSCAPCRTVTEEVLRPVWQEFEDQGVAILSIDVWADPSYPGWLPGIETEEVLRGLQRATGVPWRHALDTDGVWRKYGADALPRVLVVDGLGRIAFDHEGVPALADLQQAVRSALGG